MQISVIIPTYNRAIFLERAINSVLTQSYKVWEIIVVDDGSTDNTKQIVEKFSMIKYIYQKNSGVSKARNAGILAASCCWIAFLDSDDVWHKQKIEEQVWFHKKNPHTLMSYTKEQWIRDKKEVKVPIKYAKHGGHIFKECLSHCIIAPSSALLHKSIFEDVGVFDESLEVCEDYDLWLRIVCKYEVGLIDKPLIVKYAGHDDQLSFKHWGMDRFRVKSLENLLLICEKNEYKELIKKMLIQKIELLIKGFNKHKKEEQASFYEVKLNKIL